MSLVSRPLRLWGATALGSSGPARTPREVHYPALPCQKPMRPVRRVLQFAATLVQPGPQLRGPIFTTTCCKRALQETLSRLVPPLCARRGPK